MALSSQSLASAPELLCELLELRAEMAAMREQIGAQLRRIEQRVARMEHASGTRGARTQSAEPTNAAGVQRVARAPARPPTIADLSADVLVSIVSNLPEDDELAAALSCCKLRSAVAQRRLSEGRRETRTRAASAFVLEFADAAISAWLDTQPTPPSGSPA
ncbi:hypothetical protein KFE25_013832 [Diacronema lutheri]|uniref:F-box domain-containing protein n=1 Tax=Diacronema lutheri TaxID=2081491 RepID=A0A8J5XQZ1_DIALT|nr:hypothetical protein KFE25_013832 [Diacronema lutheri]